MLEFNMRALQDALDGERRGISSHAHDFLVFIAISEIADPWRTPRDKAHKSPGARARKASAAVCASQLRVVGACELCDGGHRQADRFTPCVVVVGR
jgi:hypothetical protein